MPELPEVETVRRGLEPVMAGQRLVAVDVRRADLRWPFPARMAERLTGTRIERLGRRAKYLLLDLSSGETLIVHLGMSGRMLIQGAETGVFHHEITPVGTHDHVIFDMAGGARVVFNDPRRFGAMDLVATGDLEQHRMLATLGPEPLGNALSDAYLREAFRGKRSSIKAALLDQRIIAGLGNIYVCEALWRAGIAPGRQAGRIAAARLSGLVSAIRAVIAEAIEAGGSSLRDYRQADGELGYFQHRFAVYDRAGSACSKSGCGGEIARIVQSGRSSFYCPNCQR